MNWNRFALFKLPTKYKRFDFMPRYYDERKEALEKKLRAADNTKGEGGAEKRRREISFKASSGDRWGNGEYRSKSMRANIRLLFILVAVLVAFYFVFIGLDFINPAERGE